MGRGKFGMTRASQHWPQGGKAGRLIAAVALTVLAACTPGEFSIGSRSFSFGQPQPPADVATAPGAFGLVAGQSFGHGPVRVALLLPLSGDPGVTIVGVSMANAAQLAVSFIEASGTIADNVTVLLKDTGDTAAGAAQAASEAVAEGASIILGPLKSDQVSAAGGVARSAGIVLIGFSNNAAAAGPGVYLLSVLPENEAKRGLSFAQAKGRKAFAAMFPTTEYGQVQQRAFGEASAALGIVPAAIYTFANDAEARAIVAKSLPLILSGQIDALYLPERASAPAFGTMLAQGGVAPLSLSIIGSADWEGDPMIAATPALAGAVYPAVDPAGYNAIVGEYQARFGVPPHRLATIAYTATILANASALSMSNPPYDRALLTAPAGFNGRDGVFRFNANGRSDYSLVIKQIGAGGASIVDGPKL